MELFTTYVIDDNEAGHRVTFKGFGGRVISLNKLKTKRDKVAAFQSS